MKIFAVGMNYAMHNKALHGTLSKPEHPVIFMKPDTALLKDNKPFFVPDFMGRIEYEAEVVFRIGKLGKSVPARFAGRYLDAVTVGIDFTARELQAQQKAAGHPWEISKSFDNSAAVGQWVPVDMVKDVHMLPFHLDKNGKTVQKGNTMDMLYSVDELIEYISTFFTLRTGDLLFTGCPAGCGPVEEGDHLCGWLGEKQVFDFYCK